MATRTKTASAPEPNKRNQTDPLEALILQGLQALAAANPGSRQTAASHRETLAQDLTPRDLAALERSGWKGRLSSPKAAEPPALARPKNGPKINPATFADMAPDRRNATLFWAGLCSTLSRNNGKVWLPEVAAVAVQMQVPIVSPSQLATRLSTLTGTAAKRPADQAGWLVCQLEGEMVGAQVWAKLWNENLQRFTDTIAAGD